MPGASSSPVDPAVAVLIAAGMSPRSADVVADLVRPDLPDDERAVALERALPGLEAALRRLESMTEEEWQQKCVGAADRFVAMLDAVAVVAGGDA